CPEVQCRRVRRVNNIWSYPRAGRTGARCGRSRERAKPCSETGYVSVLRRDVVNICVAVINDTFHSIAPADLIPVGNIMPPCAVVLRSGHNKTRRSSRASEAIILKGLQTMVKIKPRVSVVV